MKERYRYLRTLGRGGMSEVFLVEDRRLGKCWAMKQIRKEQECLTNRFYKEAVLMKEWNHPFLPRIVDVFEDREFIYIVMDHIEGMSLKELMNRRSWIEEKQILAWAMQLTEVLLYLHGQDPPVIYRDMKPENVMITKEGYVRLIDFGISRIYRQGKYSDTGCLGTRGYAAPEQYGGHGQSDFRTDIYSLGVVIYELFTGKNLADPPYELLPPEEWTREISPEFWKILQKCTMADPKQRYQNCQE
ncbi:MAG: serine/threonine protein kinase, partial [Lachnospiraceae bacterium]